MNPSQIPNILTIVRVILTLPIVFYLLKEDYLIALILLIIAAVTDGLDGWVAKRFRYQSRLGSILDPLADKILLMASFVTLFFLNLVPDWLMFTVVIRDVMIMAGTVGFIYASDKKSHELLTPSNLSKVNTVLQIVMVFFMIIAEIVTIDGYWVIDDYWIMAAWVAVLTSTVLSGVDYIWLWGKHMIDLERARNGHKNKSQPSR